MQSQLEGWATKQGGFIKTWKKRWFVLIKDVLHYYVGPGKAEKGKIRITPQCDVKTAPECKKQPAMKIITPSRTYLIVTENIDQAKEWVKMIGDVIRVLTNGDTPKEEIKCKFSVQDFEYVSVLGRGTYGKVQLVKQKSNGKYYAMKTMSKKLLEETEQVDQTLNERNILMQTAHPFLVSAHYTFQTDTKLFMVMDYVPGGELFGRLREEGRFSENRSRLYAAELLLGIGHLHHLGFVYRDLKPENILVDSDGHLKITDFGLAKKTKVDETTSTFCGTPEYMAPEMLLQEPYTKSIDWWCLGIIIYEMLCGLPPFYNQNVNLMYESIIKERVRFPSYITEPARDLILRLLDKNPDARLGSGPDDVEDIKKHTFFSTIDWKKVYSKGYKPEWIPQIKSIDDTSLFDPEFTGQIGGVSFEDSSLISGVTQTSFEGFTMLPVSVIPNLD